jgi:hypothetical protein
MEEQIVDREKAGKGIALVKQQSSGLVAELTSVFPGTEITTESDLTLASEALASITKYLRQWEKARTEIVQPANNFVRSINEMWKRLTDPVKREESRLRAMMSAFRARESQRRQQEYEESLQHLDEVFSQGTPAPEVVGAVPAASLKQVVTDSGNVNFTSVRKWKVEDADKIPREYWILDETRITKLVKGGVESIPGIKIWVEQVPVVRQG